MTGGAKFNTEPRGDGARIVGVVEYRDGRVIDLIREVVAP